MPESAFRGAPPPGGRAPSVYTVIGATRSALLDFTVLDERILGVRAHWVTDAVAGAGRSRACYADEGDCPLCGTHRGIWLGFLGVYSHPDRQRMVFRCGPEGAKALAKLSVPMAGLRGLRLNVSVATNHRQGSLLVKPAREEPLRPLISPHRLEPTVCMVLGCAALPDYRYAPEELAASIAAAQNAGDGLEGGE